MREELLAEELQRIPVGARARRRLSDWTWIVLTVVGLTAFVLDLAGGKGPALHRLEDALHLFSSGFPGRPTAGTSPLVEVAQQLAPLVVLFLTLKLITGVFRNQLNRLRARMRRRHVVVLGLDEKGYRAAQGFLDAGARVTCVAADASADLVEHLRVRGVIVLAADPTEETGLRAAAAQRATHVICSAELDRDNATSAALAARLARESGRTEPINIFAHIGDPELASLLRSATLGLGAVRIQFFDINAIWARELLRAGPLGAGSRAADRVEEPPEIAIVGATPIATSVLIEAGRLWHERLKLGEETRRLRIAIADPSAAAICERLSERYAALKDTCELVPVERPVDVELPGDFRLLFTHPSNSDALYLCLANEGDNVTLALQAKRQLGAEAPRVIVPATAWTFRLRELFGHATSGIFPVFYSNQPNSLDLLQDSTLESIARAVHSAYLESRRSAANFGQSPSDVPWRRLGPDYRESSRRNVDDMVAQLEALWYEVRPRYDWGAPITELSQQQVELLAQFEHERWCRERRATGWEYGAIRDEAATPRRHPLLVPWNDLSEEAREIDRRLVARRPEILARAGYELAHSAERDQLARFLHDRHVAARAAAGDAPDGPSLVPWDRLGEAGRELNRAAVDDISAKLLHLGYRMVSGSGGHPLTLDADQIEELARLEHARWRQLRYSQGWQYGPARDDSKRLHPDLVPWDELPEPRRAIDREQVEAIPSLLAVAHRSVVRLDELPAPGREALPRISRVARKRRAQVLDRAPNWALEHSDDRT